MAIKIKTDAAPDERKKSTASVKEPTAVRETVMVGREKDAHPEPSLYVSSENQASPVDTPSRTFKTRKPNGTFDRKEYNKIYQRAYRRHQRELAKANKTVDTDHK